MHTGVAQTEAIRGAAKGEQPTVGLDGPDESLEQLADVLLDGELLGRGEQLDDKVEETLREVCDELVLGDVRAAGRAELRGVQTERVGEAVDAGERRGVDGSHGRAAGVDWGSCRQILVCVSTSGVGGRGRRDQTRLAGCNSPPL